jgi:tRNA-binding EMAP/Myf-like protein
VKKDIKHEKADKELILQKIKLDEENAMKRDKAKDRVVVTGVRKVMPVS